MLKQKTNKFWNFIPVNNSPDTKTAELILYGDISNASWYGDEITPQEFSKELNALGNVDEIIVRINSGGGDVFAAVAMFTRLKNHKAKITVIIDGWAASAATIVAMAGDVIKIPSNGVFMIHNPSMWTCGYFQENNFMKFTEELTVVKNCIINTYAERTKKSKDEISMLMLNETWYIGEEAVNTGFCDEVLFGEKKEVSVITDFSRYKNIPVSLLNSNIININNQTKTKKVSENNMSEIKTVDELTSAYPELVNQIKENAISSERNRIKNIEDIELVGFENIVKKAKFDEPLNASDVALQIIAAQKKQGKKYLDSREADAEDSGINKVIPTMDEPFSNDKSNPYDVAIDKILPATKQ